MIILTNALAEHPDEGSLKAATNLTSRLKARYPDATVISYDRSCGLSDIHLNCGKLLLNRKLITLLRQSDQPVLYIPFPAPVLPTALRIWLLSRFARRGLRVLLLMHARGGRLTKLLLCGSGAEFVTLSESACEDCRTRLGLRAVCLKTGVDTHYFTPADADEKARLRVKYGVRPDQKVLLHVGHLKEGRNVRQLLKVSDRYHVFLAVSTRTEQDAKLRRELENRPHTTVIDQYLPDIRELYRMADVYFFPVREPYNCIDVPLSVLEAAACNVPVVTTPYGQLREFSGKPGFWFLDSFEPEQLNDLLDAAADSGAEVRSGVLDCDWDHALDTLGRWEP